MTRALAIAVALVSPFLFPIALTLPLVFVAGILVPPVGLVAGIMTDLLYKTSSVPFPYATFVGAAAFLWLEDTMTTFTTHWMAVVGAVFVVFVLFFPKGLWGSLLHWLRPSTARVDPVEPAVVTAVRLT